MPRMKPRSGDDGRSAGGLRLGHVGAILLCFASLTLPTVAAGQSCSGDCDGDGDVGINELIISVNVALGNFSVSECTLADFDRNGRVSIGELIRAVGSALDGCVVPTSTPTQTPSRTATRTATRTPTRTNTPTSTHTFTPTQSSGRWGDLRWGFDAWGGT